MQIRPNPPTRASTLQIILSIALLSSSAFLPGLRLVVAQGLRYPAVIDASWVTTGSLGTARYYHTATLLASGKVLVAGGEGSSGSGSSAELYDPATGLWSSTGSLGTARELHTATLLSSGKVLIAGGFNQSSGPSSSAELYDPASGSWSSTGSLGTKRYFHTATLLPSGKVLVAGGDNFSSGYLSSAEVYDPASGSWSSTGSLGAARREHTATLLPSGKVLVAGGVNNNGFLTSAEVYDPASGSWSTTGSLGTARYEHTATLLPSGKALVAGGLGSSILSSAELYDPASGSWSSTGSLGAARYFHTATLLPSGKVLVAAGFRSGGVLLSSAELYDPASESWISTDSLGAARAYHTATLLPSGKVLVAAGFYDGSALSSAELYDPVTAPTLIGAVSRKIHGAAGTFDISLPLTGTPGIECRLGGATSDYLIVLTFSGNVSVSGTPQAQVTLGSAMIGSGGVSNGGVVTVSGNAVNIPLTNVTNAQVLNVQLNSVNGAVNITVPMGVLIGDTNGNGKVNSGDTVQTRNRSGQTTDATNFRSDVNADGTVNSGDTIAVRSRSGTFVPPPMVCTRNFDGVTAPALPNGWVAANAAGPAPLWVTSTITPDTGPNDAFIDDANTITDKRLDSRPITINSASAQVSFRNSWDFETSDADYDGGVLEVSSPNISGGAFTDILAPEVGGSFVTGGYNVTLFPDSGNPIGGRPAWGRNSGGYVNTVANLGPNVNGQTIKLRFRIGTDFSTGASGWRIDTLSITGGSCP